MSEPVTSSAPAPAFESDDGYTVPYDEAPETEAAAPAAEPSERDRQAQILAELPPEELRQRALRAGQEATRHRQESRASAGKLDALQQRLDGLVKLLEDRGGAPAPEGEAGEEVPDRDTDPVGYLEHLVKQGLQPLADIQEERKKIAEAQEVAEKQRQQMGEFQQRSAMDRQAFLPRLAAELHGGDVQAATQEFEAAVSWLYDTRFAELAATHPGASAEQIEQAIIAGDLFGPQGIWGQDPDANRVAAVWMAAMQRGWQPGYRPPAAPAEGDAAATPVLRPPPTAARAQVTAAAARRRENLGMPASADGRAPSGPTKLNELLKDQKAYEAERRKYGSMTEMLQAYGKLQG